jgi:hypothetical protein
MNFKVSMEGILIGKLDVIKQREANTTKHANKKQKVVQPTTTTETSTDPYQAGL